ncbi:MAG: lactate dehydrogenase [Chloroflexia bacterium]|nr:lactate dehydrogenase [Chloroflexia bacterium]
MIDIVGYVALTLALIAMMNKKVFSIRIIHLISCVFYLIFGLLAKANPVAIGAILFSIIHIYHLYRLKASGNKLKN